MFYDENRPPHIADLGIKRTNSVYAHVGPEHTHKLNGGWLHNCLGETAILAITITDPTKVYVADGLLVGDGYTPLEYWSSLMSLRFYLHQLRLKQRSGKEGPIFTAPSSNYGRQFMDKPEKWEAYSYTWPEVLIPNSVDASKVRIVD